MVQVNWKRLAEPHSLFKPFVPTDLNDIEFYKKLVVFKKNLLTKNLYVSDEFRNIQYIEKVLSRYILSGGKHILYEIGDFGGIAGFVDILPGFKCDAIMKLWDRDIWGLDCIKAYKKLLDIVMDEFRLKRIGTSTADEKIVRMAKMAGFVEEGTQKCGFMWKGKPMDYMLLGYYKEG